MGGKRKYSVGIYSRLSVDHKDKKSESIENQIEIIRQYITKVNNRTGGDEELAVYDIYADRGISGASFERKDFERLMKDVRNHDVNCIIVKDLSRFGRDYVETGSYIEKILPFLDVRFIAVTDGFDSMSKDVSGQKLSMNIKNLVNDMYARDISIRVSAARKLSAQKGSYTGGVPPYGYCTEYSSGIRKLVIHPESAGIIRYLFECCVHGLSLKEIAASLYDKKVHRISDFHTYGHIYCRTGEILHQWTPETVKRVLLNPKAEAIVGQRLFEQAGERLKRTAVSKEREREATDEENIFRNIIYCKQCGRRMQASFYRSRITGERSYAYFCKRAYYIDNRKCDKNYIREEVIKEIAAEQIRKILQEQKLTPRKLTALNKAECDRVINKYRAEHAKIALEMQRLSVQAGERYMQYKEGGISAREFSVFRESRAEHDKYCGKRLNELKRKIRKAEIKAEEQNKFLRSLSKAGGCKQINLWLAETLIDKIVVSPDREITVYFKFCKEAANDYVR